MSASQHSELSRVDLLVEQGVVPLSGNKEFRIINEREDGDKVVIELWIPLTNSIEIDVIPHGIEKSSFSFEVNPSKASEAIHHPYSYAAHLMIDEAFKTAA